MDTASDPYAALGLHRGATMAEIARAYRRLAKAAHPDLRPGPDAGARMRRINAAWTVLSDPAARTRWDAAHPPPWGSSGQMSAPPWVRAAPAHTAAPASGRGAWVALVLVMALMAVMLIGGVIAAASRPDVPGSNSPGYHGNLP